MRIHRALPLFLAISATPAHAMLFDAWSKALAHDPDYQNSVAEQDVTREDLALARSQLLPQLSAQGSKGKADAKITNIALGGKSANRQYSTSLWSVQLRQPLIRPAALYAYRSTVSHVAASDALRQDARQVLLTNMIVTLGHLQFAEANLASARIAANNAEQMLAFNQRQLRAGNATRRDIAEAQIDFAKARQQIADAKLDKAAQESIWQQITGDAHAELQALPADLAGQLPLPDGDLPTLLAIASDKQPALLAAKEERNAAQLDTRRALSEHLPTLDLTASRSFSESNTENTIDNTFLTNRVDLQLTLPIFSGGATQARARQSAARLRQADARLESAMAKTRAQIVRALAGLSLNREQAESARTAAEAARINLRHAELGIVAGTATQADRLNAETANSLAQRDQVRANVEALINWCQLQQALGQLDENSLNTLMSLLGWKEPANQAISFGQ